MTGFQESELKGKSLALLLGRTRGEESWRGLAAQSRVRDFPLFFQSRAGGEIEVLFTGTVMKEPAGTVVGIIGVGRVQEQGY
jgi:hypothetical protein